MTWQQDIARKAREAEQSAGVSSLPTDPDAELNEIMNTIQAPPKVADQLQGGSGSLDETLGLNEVIADRAVSPPPAAAPRKRKGTAMKTRKKKAEAPEAPPQEEAVAPEPQAPVEEGDAVDPLDYIANLAGSPGKEELQQLKRVYGDIYFLPLEGDTVFIFRYLNNFEWEKELMTQPQLAQNQDALKAAVLNRCVLWPKMSPEFMNTRQAGLPNLLFEVIMKASYFIEPADALMMVQKL